MVVKNDIAKGYLRVPMTTAQQQLIIFVMIANQGQYSFVEAKSNASDWSTHHVMI